ncbi:MAG TPA: hypothetical protein VMW91_09030 [Desulfosporosinus sp.]|nr:hypothetical protein [Desulfosporosinus sp.]
MALPLPDLPEFPPPTFPELGELPSIPGFPPGQEPPVNVPGLAGGAVTAPNKGWNYVNYKNILTGANVSFKSKPFVVAVGEVRFGDILAVPYRAIPALPLSVYRCTKDDGWWILASQCGWMKFAINPDFVPDWFQDYVPEILKPPYECPKHHGPGYIERTEDFGQAVQGLSIYWTRALIDWRFGFDVLGFWIGIDLNWIRDALLKGLYWAYYGVGQAMGYIAAQLPTMMLMIQSVVNAALNDILPTFWDTTGLPKDQLVTAVNTRNVTQTGFEYYAFSKDQKTHYLAAGVP